MDEKKFNWLLKSIGISSDAFSALYTYYFPKIVNHIRLTFGKRGLGEDVAHDFFMKFLEQAPDFYVERPTSWVLTLCDNMARTILKRENRYTELAEDMMDFGYSGDTVFEQALFGEYAGMIKELDDLTRKIVIMHCYEGYSLKEIADVENLSYASVRQRCSRALKKLGER